jgi:hypothetical protein
MRRTLSSLMVLGIIGGCSGGDGSTGGGATPTGDTQAPSLVITAPASIEGGETVALAVAVTDNVDTGLTPTLSCNGGTLTGSLLVTTPVTADTVIRCTATATDKAGNTGTTAVNITVKKTVATLGLAEGSGTFAAGQYGLLTAGNLPLTEASYQGKLDGAAITLSRNGAGFLVFGVPTDLAAGAHAIVVTIGSRTYSVAITSTAAPSIADPKTAVRTALTASKNSIDALIASSGASMTATVRAQFASYSTQLGQGIAQIDTMSASDLSKLAISLQANDVFQPGFETSAARASLSVAQASSGLSDCQKAAGVATLKTLAWSVALVGGGIVAITPGGFTQVLGIAMIAAAYYKIDKTADYIVSAYNLCTTETGAQVESSNTTQAIQASGSRYVQPLAVAQRYGFKNNTPQNFTVKRTLGLEPTVAGSINGAIGTFEAAIGTSFFSSAAGVTRVGALTPERSELVPSSDITLGSISSSLVTGTKTGSGTAVTLTFKTASTTEANIDFDFVLNRANGTPISVPAQLTIGLPGADDAAIEVTQGLPATTVLQVRGQTSVEIVTQPGHGSATLSNAGLLTYTPSGQYFGPDQLTYRARNASGVSTTATVLIAVVRKFDKYWDFKTVATVTKESEARLCEATETKVFTLIISRVSDTQYTTTYKNTPVTFSMASRDDPAGLKTSFTVTYPETPGQTTETISASIPDSAHINGTGTFSYVGPANSFCSGTIVITGNPSE